MFEGDCPLIVDEFLYYYKPFEINQLLGFYQFTARGKDCRLIKSLVTSDRNWKTKFFFVSGFWAGHPVEVDKDPFPPYTGELGNLRPEGMLIVVILLFIIFIFNHGRLTILLFYLFIYLFSGVRRPHLSRFYLERVQKC